jgi:hypothetical protein
VIECVKRGYFIDRVRDRVRQRERAVEERRARA